MLIKIKGKIGYALGGGVARGLFHIGVLNVLEENHIYPDVIVGTSMGAIIGALYAGGTSAREIKQIAVELDWKRIARLADIALPNKGLIQGKRITSFLESILRVKTFSQLKIIFACVAADIMTGEQVVLQKGSLVEAIRASISLPAILPPVKINGRYLVDGGLVNVVPVSVCRDLGADFVIGVNVIPVPKEDLSIQEACEKYYDYQSQSAINDQESLPVEHGSNYLSHLRDIEKGIKNFLLYRLPQHKKKMANSIDCTVDDKTAPSISKEPTLATVVSQTLSIIQYRIAMENLKNADIAITPFSGNIGFWQFLRATEAISAGEIATRLALQRNDVAKIILDDTRSAIL